MNEVFIGIGLSLLTALAFGSYTSFNKLPRVVESNINPIVFNLYFMLGALLVCVASTVAAIGMGYEVAFTYLGLISGFLLTLSGMFSFISIPRIGVAYTWAIAATTGCITAFVEGVIIGNTIENWWATIASLVVLMLSAATIVLIKDITALFSGSSTATATKDGEVKLPTLAATTTLQGGVDGETVPLTSHTTSVTVQTQQVQVTGVQQQQQQVQQQTGMSRGGLTVGVFFSVLAGICLASIPLPSLFVPPNAVGLCYFFSLGVGCLLVFPFTLIALICDGFMQSRAQSHEKFEGLGYAFNESNFIDSERNVVVRSFKQCGMGIKYLLCENNDSSLWKVRQCLVPGVLSGIVWNAGNVAGILALQYINYIFLNALVAISTPIAALYGVFLWRELTKTNEIAILFVATFCLIGANVLLAYGLYGDFA